MATEVIITNSDDLDGSTTDVKTIRFSLDGNEYAIDLGPKNRAKLEKALAPFIEKGRPERKGTTRRGKVKGNASKVRSWAILNGLDVSERGRIPQEIYDLYNSVSGRPIKPKYENMK